MPEMSKYIHFKHSFILSDKKYISCMMQFLNWTWNVSFSQSHVKLRNCYSEETAISIKILM